MDYPSISQAVAIPLIFKDEAIEWRIFVSANGIIGRPRLVRTLKKAGAMICSDPKQANVILVDSSSDAGKEFIRDWGDDASKVVLEYKWVDACIRASKCLGKDDQWGGFLTQDDGLPIAKGEEFQDAKSPLPTPRITPPEAPPPERQSSVQSAPTSAPEIPSVAQSPFQGSFPSASPLPYSQIQHNQQAYQHMISPYTMPQMQQQTYAQVPLFPQSGQNASMPSYPPASQGAVPQNMFSQGMYFPSGMFPPNMFPQGIAPHYVGSMMNPNGYYPGIRSPSNASFSQGSPEAPYGPSAAQHSIPPSFRRKSPVLSRSTPTSYTSGDPMRSTSPTIFASSMFSQAPSQTTPNSASITSNLFKSKDGHELSFFVQVDLSNRSRAVAAIKKNGGKIVSSNQNADYAILYSQSKTFDQLLQSTMAAERPAVNAAFVHDCVEQNKLLDTSPYEFDTPKTKSNTPRGKRKRVKSEEDSFLDREEERRLEKNRRQKERRDQAKVEKASPVKKAKSSKAEPLDKEPPQSSPVQTDCPSRPRSPTPPPEHTRQRRGNSDGYLYSESERDYTQRYIKILLQRDHTVSGVAIAKALYDKASFLMDHHSLGSWRTFVNQEPIRSVLESARKTAGIEFRKRQAKSELLAKEIDIVAQFYATGGGRQDPDDEDEDDDTEVWKRLTEQVKCQTSPSWFDFYNENHIEIQKRYEQLIAST